MIQLTEIINKNKEFNFILIDKYYDNDDFFKNEFLEKYNINILFLSWLYDSLREQKIKNNLKDYQVDFKNKNFKPETWNLILINPYHLYKEMEINTKMITIGRNAVFSVKSKYISSRAAIIKMSKGLWFIEEHPDNKNGLNF